jgi:hypothetical protein
MKVQTAQDKMWHLRVADAQGRGILLMDLFFLDGEMAKKCLVEVVLPDENEDYVWELRAPVDATGARTRTFAHSDAWDHVYGGPGL